MQRLLFAALFLLAGCGPTTVNIPPGAIVIQAAPVQSAPAEQLAAPTPSPVPSASPAPTPTPAPCTWTCHEPPGYTCGIQANTVNDNPPSCLCQPDVTGGPDHNLPMGAAAFCI